MPHDTILLIEIEDSDTPWAAPGDLDVDELEQRHMSGVDGDGVFIAFADLEVWYLRQNLPVEVVKRFCRVETAAIRDRDVELGPYRLLD